MPAKESSPLQMIVTLVAISAVAGVLLSGVKQITAEPIAKAMLEEKLQAIRAVLPQYDNDPVKDSVQLETDEGPVEAYIGRKDGKFVGAAIPGTSYKGYGGELRVMVGVSPQGDIHGLQVLILKETPGLGDACEKPKFKDQFLGQQLGGKFDFKVKKDGGSVQQLTAATITSRAYTGAVLQALELFKDNKDKFK